MLRVCERVGELAGPAEPPARLHGDLWSGNVHAGADGRVWLLDPAAHGGHRETDLAMLALFGHPHLERVLAGYADVAHSLPAGERGPPCTSCSRCWCTRCLFGGGYGARAATAARVAWG